MNYTFRTLIMLLIAFGILIGVYFSMPPVVYEPKGILLPLTQLKPPINPDQVRVYEQGSFPPSFTDIGRVNLQYHSAKASYRVAEIAINHAREIAAQHGANGLLISLNAHTLPDAPESISFQVLRGVAIYIPTTQPTGNN